MKTICELSDSELENVVGGLHYYVDKSNPVQGKNGRLCYNIYSSSVEAFGDWQNLFKGKGAKDMSISMSMSHKVIPVDQYDAFRERAAGKHTFHEC